MPELPEVETVVRGLAPLIVGRTIRACPHVSPLMVPKNSRAWEARLAGQRILRIDRQGKWIFVRLSAGDTLVVHLGMTGRLMVAPQREPPLPHTHLRIALDRRVRELRLVDPRRFGELMLLDQDEWTRQFSPARLGPDALTHRAVMLLRILEGTKRSLKAVLLDQRALAGIGNIYADESLYRANLHPRTRGCDLDQDQVRRLSKSIRQVLRRAVEAGGSTIRDYVDARGEAGMFQHRHLVYGRAGQPCRRCRSLILVDRTIVRGRATHFCPQCQPPGCIANGSR